MLRALLHPVKTQQCTDVLCLSSISSKSQTFEEVVRWQVCADDIEAVCGYERDSLDTVEGFDARVIQCLQVRAHADLQSCSIWSIKRLDSMCPQHLLFIAPVNQGATV